MYDLRFSIVEKSKSKGIKKALIIIVVVASFISIGICVGSTVEINPLILVFGSLLFMVAFFVFFDNYKTYNAIGHIELNSDFITIQKESESFTLEIWKINYFDLEYKGYYGSIYDGDVLGTIVSKDGTGNILEVGTDPTVYRVNCLLENESQAMLLRNYVIKFNKSKQNKNG